MSCHTFSLLSRLAVPLLVWPMVGCSSAGFTSADMVMGLVPPDDFRWAQNPVTLEDPSQLNSRIGPESQQLLQHNWRSSTFGRIASDQAEVELAVHQLSSKEDAADILAENKYPDAEPLKLGREAYRWLDRAAPQTIFFRRDVYFCQLTVDSHQYQSVLEPMAADLDKLLTRRRLLFW